MGHLEEPQSGMVVLEGRGEEVGALSLQIQMCRLRVDKWTPTPALQTKGQPELANTLYPDDSPVLEPPTLPFLDTP